jgi:hypothetical protein
MKLIVSSLPIVVVMFMPTLLVGMSTAFLSPDVVHSRSGSAAATTTFVRTTFYHETNHLSTTPRISLTSSSTTKLHFSENCEVMLDTVCGAIPWPFRKAARTKFVKELQSLNDQQHEEITETHVYQVVLQLTPSEHHQKTMELLDQFKMAVPSAN